VPILLAIFCAAMTAGGLLRYALHQLLRLLQKDLIGGGIGAALFNEVVQQLRHLRVKPRVGELVADDGFAEALPDLFRPTIRVPLRPSQLVAGARFAHDLTPR
jgi:hypothetical protein